MSFSISVVDASQADSEPWAFGVDWLRVDNDEFEFACDVWVMPSSFLPERGSLTVTAQQNGRTLATGQSASKETAYPARSRLGSLQALLMAWLFARACWSRAGRVSRWVTLVGADPARPRISQKVWT